MHILATLKDFFKLILFLKGSFISLRIHLNYLQLCCLYSLHRKKKQIRNKEKANQKERKSKSERVMFHKKKKATWFEVYVLKEEVSRYRSTLTARFVKSVGFYVVKISFSLLHKAVAILRFQKLARDPSRTFCVGIPSIVTASEILLSYQLPNEVAIEASKWQDSCRKQPTAATIVLHIESNYAIVFQVAEY